MTELEKLAKEYAERCIPNKYTSAMATAIKECIEEAMVYGANAVLDKIDNICYQSNKTYEERYLLITDLIKELKGE